MQTLPLCITILFMNTRCVGNITSQTGPHTLRDSLPSQITNTAVVTIWLGATQSTDHYLRPVHALITPRSYRICISASTSRVFFYQTSRKSGHWHKLSCQSGAVRTASYYNLSCPQTVTINLVVGVPVCGTSRVRIKCPGLTVRRGCHVFCCCFLEIEQYVHKQHVLHVYISVAIA